MQSQVRNTSNGDQSDAVYRKIDLFTITLLNTSKTYTIKLT